jgi:hypothetical protein
MAHKKRPQSYPTQYANLRNLLDLVTHSENVPSLATVLELGRELEAAGLRYFINAALPAGNADPDHFTRNLVYTSCRCFWSNDPGLALSDENHVSYILDLIKQRPGFWVFVRDELEKFAALVLEELDRKAEPRSCRGPAIKHEAKAEARDCWLYRQATKKNPPTWKALMAKLSRIAPERGWQKLSSVQGVKQAVDRYIHRNGLAPLPRRKEV